MVGGWQTNDLQTFESLKCLTNHSISFKQQVACNIELRPHAKGQL